MATAHEVEVKMLIRKTPAEVYKAIVDPEITTNFWFTKSSGRLENNKLVLWEWEMYGVSATIFTKELIENKVVIVEWQDKGTTVEFNFNELPGNVTYLVIRQYGFVEIGDALIEVIKDNTGGFTTLIDGMKAYLEYGVKLDLTSDKFHDKLVTNRQVNF